MAPVNAASRACANVSEPVKRPTDRRPVQAGSCQKGAVRRLGRGFPACSLPPSDLSLKTHCEFLFHGRKGGWRGVGNAKRYPRL